MRPIGSGSYPIRLILLGVFLAVRASASLCVAAISTKSDPSEALFLLPPHSERYLIAIAPIMPKGDPWVSFGDYIGSHSTLTTHVILGRAVRGLGDISDEHTDIIYAGEIRIENKSDLPALGKIVELNVTSRFLWKRNEERRERGLSYRNDPTEFLRLVRGRYPHLVAENPRVWTFSEENAHLLTVRLGDTRHTILDELYYLLARAQKLQALEETFSRTGDGKLSTLALVFARLEWMVPHLRKYSTLGSQETNDLMPTLTKWRQTGSITPVESEHVVRDLKLVTKAYMDLAEETALVLPL